jgi:hypothetical protein
MCRFDKVKAIQSVLSSQQAENNADKRARARK